MHNYNEPNEYGNYGNSDCSVSLQTIRKMMSQPSTQHHHSIKQPTTPPWRTLAMQNDNPQPQKRQKGSGGPSQLASNNELDLLHPITTHITSPYVNLTVTNTNTNLTITPVINDPFFEPFGDHTQLPKPPNTVHMALQNFGRWMQWKSHEK